MVKLTDRWIAWFVPEAIKGRETPQIWAPKKGVSVRRLQALIKLYRDTGEIPTLNPQRRPKGPPLTTQEERQIDEAHEYTKRGARKTWLHLRRKGIRIPKHKVHSYFRARGHSKPNRNKQKKRKRCRYERNHSGSLLHGDWHQTSEDHPWLIAWIDDASRKLLVAAEFERRSGASSIATFDQALHHSAEWGLAVQQVNTDKGSEFYANPQEGKKQGVSKFTTHVEGLGITHIPSKTNNPQTNGKLERLWYEYDKHRWRFESLQEFIDWNNDQVHDELWIDDQLGIYEVPEEAFQRKLPQEVLVGLFLRLAEGQPKRMTVEDLYAN